MLSLSHEPKITDNKTTDALSGNTFTSTLTNLEYFKTYHVRAYATNSAGTVYGNEREFRTEAIPPTVTTSEVTNRSYRSATAGGEVTADGGNPVTDKGICYATHTNPKFNENNMPSGAGLGPFIIDITGLDPNTVYHARAYAATAADTAYGADVEFKTLELTLSTLTTIKPDDIIHNSAVSGGDISSDGGSLVTERGVCWGKNTNPTLGDNHKSAGSGDGVFSVTIDGLDENNEYHVRAYAINVVGTAYGQDEVFKTRLPSINFNENLTYGTVSDVDGNIYKTIQIGTQTWMAENLRTTKFNDGAPVPLVSVDAEWAALETPGYCWYYHDKELYGEIYGALYNWYVVGSICPVGWHVPFTPEWETLISFLGGESIAGGKMKEIGFDHWFSPNLNATDSSGFTALPGGYRDDTGPIGNINGYGYWWTASNTNINHSWYRRLDFGLESTYTGSNYKRNGFSIRCIKD